MCARDLVSTSGGSGFLIILGSWVRAPPAPPTSGCGHGRARFCVAIAGPPRAPPDGDGRRRTCAIPCGLELRVRRQFQERPDGVEGRNAFGDGSGSIGVLARDLGEYSP